ncbi:MAG: hypothetical protein LBQ52_06525 [Helicobacteraceae bacterium]|jgi:hypothetical protein|nr:hypothetical protein [Helicobacteraceae bacterium]
MELKVFLKLAFNEVKEVNSFRALLFELLDKADLITGLGVGEPPPPPRFRRKELTRVETLKLLFWITMVCDQSIKEYKFDLDCLRKLKPIEEIATRKKGNGGFVVPRFRFAKRQEGTRERLLT